MTLSYQGQPVKWHYHDRDRNWQLHTDQLSIYVEETTDSWTWYCPEVGDCVNLMSAISDVAAKREAVIAVRKHFKKMAEEAEQLFKMFGGKLKMKDVK